jgi:hypothetical protein
MHNLLLRGPLARLQGWAILFLPIMWAPCRFPVSTETGAWEASTFLAHPNARFRLVD